MLRSKTTIPDDTVVTIIKHVFEILRLNLSNKHTPIGYNIIISILRLLVHKISIPQKKYNKFLISAIPEMCENGSTTYFLTRSYDQ